MLNIARKLIWVAHDPQRNTLTAFDEHWKAIKQSRAAYSAVVNPEIDGSTAGLRSEYDASVSAFQERMPKVFDPFAGGGAIPLEAARLGCRSYGNDINPVAHIIQRASLEFPQKFGQPVVYTEDHYLEKYGKDAWSKLPAEWKDFDTQKQRIVRIPNRLSHDVEHEALALLAKAEEQIGHLYPKDEGGNKPIAYYWARTATCLQTLPAAPRSHCLSNSTSPTHQLGKSTSNQSLMEPKSTLKSSRAKPRRRAF